MKQEMWAGKAQGQATPEGNEPASGYRGGGDTSHLRGDCAKGPKKLLIIAPVCKSGNCCHLWLREGSLQSIVVLPFPDFPLCLSSLLPSPTSCLLVFYAENEIQGLAYLSLVLVHGVASQPWSRNLTMQPRLPSNSRSMLGLWVCTSTLNSLTSLHFPCRHILCVSPKLCTILL